MEINEMKKKKTILSHVINLGINFISYFFPVLQFIQKDEGLLDGFYNPLVQVHVWTVNVVLWNRFLSI